MTNILIATTQITNTEYFVLIAALVFNIPFTPKLKPVLNVLKINMFHILPIHTAVKPFFLKRVYFKLVLIKTAKEMAGNIEEPSKKKTKRSRHLEENETRILVSKWSGGNIQELLKSCTRKKPIWKEVSIFLRASGYDRDDERCVVRIQTAYRNFNDTKRRSTGTALQKKPPCYEEIDAVLGDIPTTMP